MSRDILDEAYFHFKLEGHEYEYGRPDLRPRNHSPGRLTDPSRNEQDLDGDGLYGIDCSAFVWRGLKSASYDVGDSAFTTSQLFKGKDIQALSFCAHRRPAFTDADRLRR